MGLAKLGNLYIVSLRKTTEPSGQKLGIEVMSLTHSLNGAPNKLSADFKHEKMVLGLVEWRVKALLVSDTCSMCENIDKI